jgi:hypothetical protein
MSNPAGRPLPIDWFVSHEVKTRYANNVVIQHTDAEFVFSFFELLPPMLVGSPEEIQAQLQGARSAHAECVARIVMTPQQAENLLRALEDNVAKYQARFKTKGDT